MKRYMLDTNTVGYLIKRHPVVAARVTEVPMTALCISAITGGELMFGLAKVPGAERLHQAVTGLLRRVSAAVGWFGNAALRLRTFDMEGQGKALGSLDMLIAAHALETGSVLVTNDRAFGRVAGLALQDWTIKGYSHEY